MLWTAFLMGLMGSMHCIGMCGPIALVLPFKDSSRLRTTKNVLLYNGGRVITYGIIGILPGLLGLSFALAGQQRFLSIALGVFFLVMAFFSLDLERWINALPWIKKSNQWVQKRLAPLLQQKSNRAFFTIGLLNGFLPCGLVYIALAGAMLRESIEGSVLYMMLFGLGTLPMMVALSFLGQFISVKARRAIRKLLPILLILMAVFFILRGTQIELPTHLQNWIDNGAPPICH